MASWREQLRETASLLGLEEIRAATRRPLYRAIAISAFFLYGLLALDVGQMIGFVPTGQTSTTVFLFTQGQPWWNYPGVLVLFPGGFLALPFFSTLVMILVSAGVAIGMAAAVYLTARLLRHRKETRATDAGAGSVAGLTPALLTLVTLGACCSTTAAATAGLTWTAAVSGTTLDGLLIYNWYPGVFQLSVLYIALVAQEQLLRTYGWLFRGRTEGDAAEQPVASRAVGRRSVSTVALRVLLLIGGASWLLALPAEWTTAAPPALSVPLVFQAVGLHVLPSFVALSIALAPAEFAGLMDRLSGPVARPVLRGAAVALGASLVGWLPPGWAAAGAFGLGNEVVGALGGPSSWGGVIPPFSGLALLFRWGVQFLLLGGLMIVLGARPRWILAPLAGDRTIPAHLIGDAREAEGSVRLPLDAAASVATSASSPGPAPRALRPSSEGEPFPTRSAAPPR
jgi:hypothetical protein